MKVYFMGYYVGQSNAIEGIQSARCLNHSPDFNVICEIFCEVDFFRLDRSVLQGDSVSQIPSAYFAALFLNFNAD